MKVIDIVICGLSICVTTAAGEKVTLDIDEYRTMEELKENIGKTLERNGYEI